MSAPGDAAAGRRAAPGLGRADVVVLAYDLFVLALLLATRPAGWATLAAAHAGLAAAVPLLARAAARGGSAVVFAHRWYPLVLFLAFYPEAGALRNVLFPDRDALVVAWDDALFPGRWYATLPARLPLAASELVHAAYASYYLLLFLPALLAARRQPRLADAYVFAVTLAMLAHYAASFLFPTAGPAGAGSPPPQGGAFGTLVALAYRGFDRGGLAFPSTHAVAAVVAGVHAARMYPPLGAGFAALVAAILASTVLGGFHYPVDTAAGLVSGLLFVALGDRLAPATTGSVEAPTA